MGKKIVIDPGHGGKDPGAIALLGEGKRVREKDLAWQYSLTLKYLLRKKEHLVSFTRWGDLYVPLERRGRMAMGYDAFVSLHFNAGASSARGCEVWWHPPHSPSANLARAVEEKLRRICPSRGVRADTQRYPRGFCVLRIASSLGVPAILIEVDFLSNPQILPSLLLLEERVRRMEAVAEGINEFLKGG